MSLNEPPKPQLPSGTGSSEWLTVNNNEQVLTNQHHQQHHLIDLTQIQKKKLKKVFYNSSSQNLDDQPLCNLSSITSISQSPSHTCKDCLRSFKDINNYKEHRFQEHKVTEFPNIRQCKMCSYATLLKSKYDCHMRCHLNNKVIKCQRCSYSTINIRHMSKHERLHMINIKNKNNGIKTELNAARRPTHETAQTIPDKDQSDCNIKRKTNDMLLKSNQSEGPFFKLDTSRSMHELEVLANNNKKSCNQADSPQRAPSETENDLEINRNFSFFSANSERKQSLSDETCSTHSSSSPMTTPWLSSSVSTTSQSPPLMEQTKSTSTKTFHNILSLINSGNGNNGPSSADQGGDENGEADKEQEEREQIYERPMMLQAQANGNFEESFRSNFENLIKFQLAQNPNINPSTFYTNLVNNHYQQNQLSIYTRPGKLTDAFLTPPPHLTNPALINVQAQNTAAHFYQLAQQRLPDNQTDCCSDQKSCSHRTELVSLRENIFKLLHGIMPQFMSGIETFENCARKDLIQVDKMVDSLVQQISGT